MTPKSLPQIIKKAIERIDALLESAHMRWGRSNSVRGMRIERRRVLRALLEELLRHAVLQFDGGFCHVSGGSARPLTVAEMLPEHSKRNIERCLHDLKDLGLVDTQRQWKRKTVAGIQVAACWRQFSRRFWELLGLWSLLVESVKYAAAHAKLKLKIPVKVIATNLRENRNALFMEAQNCRWRVKGKCTARRGEQPPQPVCELCQRLILICK